MVARLIDHPFSAGVIPTPYNPDPALLAIVEIIRAGLVRDQHVRLHQFGTFRLRWSKERRVKHPKTGQSIIVPPAPRITFTPAKQLREWIEPNRKPVIPLEEPLNEPLAEPPNKPLPLKKSLNESRKKLPVIEPVKPVSKPEQTITVDLSEPLADLSEPSADLSEASQNTAEHQQHIQPNLQETVQDIIDEQYSPPDNLSGFISSQTNVQTDTKAETNSVESHKPNKKWALGLLAAVPLIVLLLQADFTNDSSGIQKSLPSETQLGVQTELTSEPALNTAIINKQIVRTESIALDNESSGVDNAIIDSIQIEDIASDIKQSNFNNEIVQTESITPDNKLSSTNNKFIQNESMTPVNSQSGTSEKQTASDLITARGEPTPKPFYMSPQVHTIQQGENLWNLAEKFYGDALLWPHIYRANTRTLSDPDKIITSKNLIIPGLQESPEFLTSKDRELIAEGYFMVYEFNKAKGSDQAIHFLIGAKEYSLEWLRQNKSRINEKDWEKIGR